MKHNQVAARLKEDSDKHCHLVFCSFSCWKIKTNTYRITFYGLRLPMDVVVYTVQNNAYLLTDERNNLCNVYIKISGK